jgi:hypothetical protein
MIKTHMKGNRVSQLPNTGATRSYDTGFMGGVFSSCEDRMMTSGDRGRTTRYMLVPSQPQQTVSAKQMFIPF